MRFFVASLAILSMAGCSAYSPTPAADANAGPPPSNYRSAVAQSVRETFFDPYSIRDASISAPFYASAVFDGGFSARRGWVVCVKANAKNRMGGYIGSQPSLFLFDGERVATALSGPDFVYQVEAACAAANYVAFDEIEGQG